jgi:hypothetical protein
VLVARDKSSESVASSDANRHEAAILGAIAERPI